MGTRFELVIPGSPVSSLESLAKEVERQVLWWEEHLSRFREGSDIAHINREGAEWPVPVDERVFSLLEECDRFHRITGGLFDPAILALQDYWQGEGPHDAAAAAALAARHGWRNVVLDASAMTVSLRTSVTGIDPGAFGKGMALRKVQELFTAEGIENALISFGGSSITARGHHPHGPHWPVGIPNIFNPTENVYLFEMRDTSLSTSGVSAQRLPRGEEAYLHVLHPRSGMPARGWKSVSVQHPDPLTAEVLSTAFLLAEEEEHTILQEKFPGAKIILVKYSGRTANIYTFGS